LIDSKGPREDIFKSLYNDMFKYEDKISYLRKKHESPAAKSKIASNKKYVLKKSESVGNIYEKLFNHHKE